MKLCKNCKWFSREGHDWREVKENTHCINPKNFLCIEPVYGKNVYRLSPEQLRDFVGTPPLNAPIEICGAKARWYEKISGLYVSEENK